MDLTGLWTNVVRLHRSPRETIGAALMLVVGVGCVSAAFAIVEAALIRRLPYREPHRLVSVWDADGPRGYEVLSTQDVEALTHVTAFDGVAKYAGVAQRLQVGTEAQTVRGARVSGRFFEMLGVGAARGRSLASEDTRLTDVLPIVISARLSRAEAFHPGDLMKLDGLSHKVVGVMPPAFFFPDRDVDYWIPIVELPPALRGAASTVEQVRAVARLLPGVEAASAESAANVALRNGEGRHGIRVQLLEESLRAPIRTPLLMLQAGAGLVLLLTWLNSAWLFRARVRRLDHACAVMAACGASPRRLMATFVAEAACVGAVVVPFALLVAAALLALSARVENGALRRIAIAEVTGPVLAVTALVAVLAAVASCVPALALVGRAACSGNLTRHPECERPRRSYAQTAMAIQAVIVFAIALEACFLGLVFDRMLKRNVGFDTVAVAGAEVRLPPSASPAGAVARYLAVVDRLNASGVRSAVSNVVPLAGAEQLTSARTPDRPARDQDMVRLRPVNASYFSLWGVQTLEGRVLLPRDAGRGAIVIDEAFEKKVLGQRAWPSTPILFGGASWEVVGVAKSVRHSGLFETPEPTVYLLYDDVRRLAPQTAAMVSRDAVFVVDGAARAIDRLRAVLATELPEAAVRRSWRFQDLVWAASGERPLMTLGITLFAAVTLLLMGAGLHGMMAHETASRRRDIGVRLALGAAPRRIAGEVLKPVIATYLTAGIGGTCLAFAFQALLTRATFVPEPALDPAPWAAPILSAVVLLVVLAAAASLPVVRATRVDPVDTIKTPY